MSYWESIQWLSEYLAVMNCGSTVSVLTTNGYVTIKSEQCEDYVRYVVSKDKWDYFHKSPMQAARRAYHFM